ncbi:hypothetical protein EJO66_24505 [Variovorax beijingensis]|uniref:Uncharacterized protein n=1 Tax=Variovorax beijingensis TaxID=2496117 RepID=A0ABY0A1I9_9BURK|nr:hypothetical protein [Variovorax beijingensis]RSZ31013.1 hypothetical protein EJO66_24505 [Variovorax beijingensis]
MRSIPTRARCSRRCRARPPAARCWRPEHSARRQPDIEASRAQRLLAEDAANVFLYQPQFITVAARGLRGLWKDTPIFVNDIAALSWS